MKRLLALAIMAVSAAAAFSQASKKGPNVDRIYFDVRTQDAAVRDTAEGKTDLCAGGIQGAVFNSLPQSARDKLGVYGVPSGSWSLLFNPVPNTAPYTVTAGGKTRFNPLAIREVRYAFNFLIDRKRIVEEILGGAGGAAFTMAIPGRPGTYRYNLIPAKLGFTASGNEKRAISEITDAITKACELPALKGTLEKVDGWWTFNGEPVTLTFLLRADDPDGRLREGRYIADQIEKAGIKVELLEYDKRKCLDTVYYGNPAEYQWSIYTEGWGAGETRQYWDDIVSQMYAPWNGNMPGGQIGNFWNYGMTEIDDLTRKIRNAGFLDAGEYWSSILKAQEIGLREAVRVPICYQDQLYVTNKSRFTPLAFGFGDGLDSWFYITADVKPEKGGVKTLRATNFSVEGSQVMGAWDPVGADGFSDEYSRGIAELCSDSPSFLAPRTARDTPWRVSWKDVQTKVKQGKDKAGNDVLVGQIPVPENAILYDSASKSWKKVGPGITSFSKATYTYKWGKWHTGRPITIADVLYSFAFIVEWMTKDGEDDPYYDAAYESNMRPVMAYKGILANKDGTLTLYMDYGHFDPDRVAGHSAIFVETSGSFSRICVSWEITEALSRLVAEGGKSGTAWSFSPDPAFTEVDVLDPGCLEDIKAKLADFKAARYVPASVKEYMTPADAAASYDAAVKWIDAHKNAYIANGAFSINDVNLRDNILELRANRDPGYPFEVGYWNRFFKTQVAHIDGLTVPPAANGDMEARVAVKVSVVEYPTGAVKPADKTANVSLTLVTPDGEKLIKAIYQSAGRFIAVIPAKDMNLVAGDYTLVAQSFLKDEEPSIATSILAIVK